jgi:hypothetical protein
MGWDAHSSVKKKKEALKDFKEAAEWVKAKCGSVDGFLSGGSLDISNSGNMLAEATRESVYDKYGWEEKKVKGLYESAYWDFHYEEEDATYYWSARKFLEVCAKHNLRIDFSW